MTDSTPLPKSYRTYVLLLCACFVCKGIFYSIIFPMWEGYDEYSHFAFIQYFSDRRELPVQETRVSLEVEKSLQLVPVPWLLRPLGPASVTHDEYWRLTPEERSRRQQQLAGIPATLQIEAGMSYLYEGQQSPLYYWLMSIPYKVLSARPLATRVFVFRLINVLLASLVIPIAFAVSRRVFNNDSWALAVPLVITSMPELYVDVSRVGNQVIAMVLYSLFTWLCLRAIEGEKRFLPLAGLTLGLLILAKAYGIAAIPALIAIAIYSVRKKRNVATVALATLSLAAVPLIAGWWFLRNTRMVGAPLWMHAIPAKRTGVWEVVSAVGSVNWVDAFSSLFASHVWFGNWSFLAVRSWMYHFFEVVALTVAVGIVIWILRHFRGHSSETLPLIRIPHLVLVITLFAFFLAAISHHILMTYLDTGLGASCGWYVYAVIVPEAVLIVGGLAAFRWGKHLLLLAMTALICLEMYATHWILVPYYTGLIRHTEVGALQSFHPEYLEAIGVTELVNRLLVNRLDSLTPSVMLCVWGLYLLATLMPWWTARRLLFHTAKAPDAALWDASC